MAMASGAQRGAEDRSTSLHKARACAKNEWRASSAASASESGPPMRRQARTSPAWTTELPRHRSDRARARTFCGRIQPNAPQVALLGRRNKRIAPRTGAPASCPAPRGCGESTRASASRHPPQGRGASDLVHTARGTAPHKRQSNRARAPPLAACLPGGAASGIKPESFPPLLSGRASNVGVVRPCSAAQTCPCL